MNEPLTEDLLAELLSAGEPSEFIDRHDLGNRQLSDYLQQLIDDKRLKRIDVVHEAGIDETYGWRLFTGERENPSRDIVLQLAFAMRMTLREADRTLLAAKTSTLYCKNRRDAIIIFCLAHGASLAEANETLYEFGEATIGEKA